MVSIQDTRRTRARAVAQKNGGPARFAEKMGMSTSQVSQIIGENPTRNIGGQVARRIEGVFGLEPGELDRPLDMGPYGGTQANVEAGPDVQGRIPLISWVQAGSWCGSEQPFGAADAEEWMLSPRKLSHRAFALRVRGASMEPRFQSGDIIFVDPDVAADHGRHVIVRLDDSGEITFKQLVIEGGERFLRPLNPDWPGPRLIRLAKDATICGVVVGKWVPE